MADQIAPIPEFEFERILKLSEYDLDYAEMKDELNNLTRLAASITGMPISLINLLDRNIQWTISNFGMEAFSTPRENTVCQYVVLDDKAFEVKNMADDERFRNMDYVLEEPNLRYYYGVPLTSPDGFRIGAMCVMDTNENQLSPDKAEMLKIIADEVVTCIEYEQKLKYYRFKEKELIKILRKIGHDIRGPIGGIVGLAEILNEQAQELELEEFIHFLDLINDGGNSVLELTNDIISEIKIDSKFSDSFNSLLTLDVLKDKLQHLYLPQAVSKGVAFSVSNSEQYQDLAFPRVKLIQILGNLISNAIKFTQNGGDVEISLSITEDPKTMLICTVSDDGVGISPDQIKAIQAGNAVSTEGTGKERGFGFGFRLAKQLTESLNGTLEVKSEKDKGSTITVRIPFQMSL